MTFTVKTACDALGVKVGASEDELKKAFKANADIIGINNRDLKTFNVDIQTSFRLKKLIPPDIFVISESGIKTPAHVQSLRAEGFAGALVGESLLREERPSEAVRKLLGAA